MKRVIPLSRPTVVPPASELTVLARSQSQGEVTRYASILTVAEEHPKNTPRYFQVELPFTDLSSLTILRDGKVIYRQSVAASASREKPTVPQLAEQGAEVCVQWQAGEYEGVSLMHVSDAGQRTVLTMQNPQPSACLPTDGIPDGGHWLLVTHRGLTAISHQVKR